MKRLMLIACLATPFLPVNVQAQQNRVEISITPVAGPVYMLQGGGGNIGVVADPLAHDQRQVAHPKWREADLVVLLAKVRVVTR